MGPGRPLKPLDRSAHGFLLLEVLIAAIVFSFVVASNAATATYHERALRKYQDRNSATFVAQQEMEALLAESYSRLPQAAADYPLDIDVKRTVDGTEVTSQYHCEVEVTEATDKTVRTVLVTVSYQDGEETKTVNLESDVFWSR